MTTHLLALTVGPVQEFIAAARRTRDLWFGSFLLSEISKAAAKSVHDDGGKLIFPAPIDAAELAPDSTLNVANVILAELPAVEPKQVAEHAKAAAQARWREFADEVFRDHQPAINADIWNDQVDDVIELYAAWVPSSPQTYKADRAKVMRLLAARKSCRNFLPAKGRAGVPKSSLDGLRESALLPREQQRQPSRRPMRLQEGEQLDVVGMVKRTATGTRPYPSVARVAADPWLRGVGAQRLADLRAACSQLGSDVVHQLDISTERGHPHYAAFPFEGTPVLRSRYREFLRETDLSERDLDSLRRALTPLTEAFGDPNPYLAVLLADGDRMGQALSQLGSAADHRDFSRALASFAGQTPQVVHASSGVLVYAGGDDVLAFVPVDRCLACARALHDEFENGLRKWSKKTQTDLTLSVGVAIAHFMEPLEDLLSYGRDAESHAKEPHAEDGQQERRNGLAVHVLKRGGGPIAVRANWSARPDQHLQTLATWIGERAVSGRVAYDLRTLAAAYDGWPAETVKDAIQGDTLSVMKGKQALGDSKIHEVGRLVRERVAGADSLRQLSDELLVARQIAVAIGQASGSPAPKGVPA
jgi:CRISPR-associated protein Cmr2